MNGFESQWRPPHEAGPRRSAAAGAGVRGPRGPRWIISVRALVVTLAIVVAALGVLWLESASVSGASAQLAAHDPAKVAVPGVQAMNGTPLSSAAPGDSASPGPSGGSAAGVPGSGRAGELVVHVAGAVSHPGIVSLPAGSRVYQAIAAVGGALPAAELSALNLAAVVSDGQQVLVLTKSQALAGHGVGPMPAAGGRPTPRAAAPINLNTATAGDLDALPGVGPVLAQRIVQWRTDHGPFKAVAELDAVTGIGAKMLENLRALVSVG
ncbi:helix-hairpin-helix domain-containing protein [Specibacter sp. RAF43]|uniref:ComEA family DNA-binding protein n=1 Tax=Specibacter sp. RAF43 TaxID=3233057 RepID=UPI003F9C2FA6